MLLGTVSPVPLFLYGVLLAFVVDLPFSLVAMQIVCVSVTRVWLRHSGCSRVLCSLYLSAYLFLNIPSLIHPCT
jgi:hypothetical protein